MCAEKQYLINRNKQFVEDLGFVTPFLRGQEANKNRASWLYRTASTVCIC